MIEDKKVVTIEDEEKDKVAIIVNGRKRIVPSTNGELSFDEVVRQAFAQPPSRPDIMFTVSYRNGAGRPLEGRLSPGQNVKIQDGTVFNVSFTDKS